MSGVGYSSAQVLDCVVLTREKAKEIAKVGGSKCKVSCKGCGCKGGPGYRNSQGKCVSYANLIKDCGEAPHLRCVRECTPVVEGCDRP